MKKYLLILAMFGFVLYGCDKTPEEVEDDTSQTTPENPDDPQPGDDTEVPQFAITGDGTFAIPFGGGEFEVAVETNLEYTVAIPENAKSWVSVKATRTLRTETVVFAVEANADNEERSTAVTFIDENGQALQTITIKQEAKPEEKEPNEPNDPEEPEKPQFGVTGEVAFAMPAEGGEFEVAVETNLEYNVAISEDAQSWVALKETRALRTETLVFAVAANDDSEERSTSIAFIGEDGKTLQAIAIKQEAAPEEDEPEEEGIPLNEIHYTTTDGEILVFCRGMHSYQDGVTFGNGVNLVSNTYENGVGILKFDNTVTTISGYTFEDCTDLTSIIIPDGVTTIRDFAFGGCTGLTNITIPNCVTIIGYCAFANCYNLTNITLPESVTTIGSSAFMLCAGLTSITIPESVTTIGDGAFRECAGLTSVTIPNSVVSVGDGIFEYCSALSEFKGKFASSDGRCLIVDGVLNSFAPAGLTEYSVADMVTDIGGSAFWGCTNLTSITIPESVTIIERHAFRGCTSLTSITIPESVTEIMDYAFYDCTSLDSVYCKALTPPNLEDYGAFLFNADGRKIYVPYQSLDAYKTAEGWRMYANDIVPYDFENDKVYEGDDIPDVPNAVKIAVKSATDNQHHEGFGADRLIDGDFDMNYHSPWAYPYDDPTTIFPVVWEFEFAQECSLDYFILYSGTTGNGRIGKFNVEYKSGGVWSAIDETFDFGQRGYRQVCMFPSRLENVTDIRLTIYDGYGDNGVDGGYVAAYEIEFYGAYAE